MAGKHSDAPRIKQVDNSFGKEDFTIYKFPAVPSDTFTNIYTLSKWGLQTSSSELHQKKKKNCDGQRQGHPLQQSQPVSKNVNELLYKRIKREQCNVSTHSKSSSSSDYLRYCTDGRAQTQPLPHLKWPPFNRDYVTLPHEESKLKLIWYSQAAARRDMTVLSAHPGTPHRAIPSQWTGTHWPASKQRQHKKSNKTSSGGGGITSPCGCTGRAADNAPAASCSPHLCQLKRRNCISKGDFKSI